MSDRKAELEKKKAKLQAMREEKERRRREKESKDVSYCNIYNSMIVLIYIYLTTSQFKQLQFFYSGVFLFLY